MSADVRLRGYRTIVFDCDGVLLDSNKIKTEAFSKVASPFGDAAAEALVLHHRQFGGVSRNAKFDYFVRHILGRQPQGGEVDSLVAAYANEVASALRHCAVTPGLEELRNKLPDAVWMVVSGGAQAELRTIFEERGLASMFDGGIFGSPDSKDVIFAEAKERKLLANPGIYLGDSRYDHEAATRARLDFVFVSDWTEFTDWQTYCQSKRLQVIGRVADLSPVPKGSSVRKP